MIFIVVTMKVVIVIRVMMYEFGLYITFYLSTCVYTFFSIQYFVLFYTFVHTWHMKRRSTNLRLKTSPENRESTIDDQSHNKFYHQKYKYVHRCGSTVWNKRTTTTII